MIHIQKYQNLNQPKQGFSLSFSLTSAFSFKIGLDDKNKYKPIFIMIILTDFRLSQVEGFGLESREITCQRILSLAEWSPGKAIHYQSKINPQQSLLKNAVR